MKKEKRLADLKCGESGRVLRLLSCGTMRRRFLDIGIVPGTAVTCFGKSPLGDPSAYRIRGKLIAIRNEDAEKILLI